MKPVDDSGDSLTIQKSDFYPVGSLEGKHNYKRFLRIEPDGSVRETVRLDIADTSHREQVICFHYLRHLVRHFLRERIGVNVLGRDCPWDFKLQLSTGQIFFLELTSIADSARHFEINKREERFTQWAGEKPITFRELRKLAWLFPSEALNDLAREYAQAGCQDAELVKNPLRDVGQCVFISSMLQPAESLTHQIRSAIERKAMKAHAAKETTVLIIDNRSSAFDLQDFRIAAKELAPLLDEVPFPEVWLYTGYCSDDDGNNAEFSFAPLKVTSAQRDALHALQVDSAGRHVW